MSFKRSRKTRLTPMSAIDHIQPIFTDVLKKPGLKNLCLCVVAILRANNMRINEVAASLPVRVKTHKTRQKRLLRFLDTPFPESEAIACWCEAELRAVSHRKGVPKWILIDETQVYGDEKAIVASLPFRNRAIPIFWLVYNDDEIRDCTYKSHNAIIQKFCEALYGHFRQVFPEAPVPVLVFDRGFARAEYVMKFFLDAGINFVMRVPQQTHVKINGETKCLKTLETPGDFPDILYQQKLELPLHLYVCRSRGREGELMYLVSNTLRGPAIEQCYRCRQQIEQGFRDIKTGLGFGEVSLKKPTRPRIGLLWFLACVSYGAAFVIYEMSATRWARPYNTGQKRYSIFHVIKLKLAEAYRGFWIAPFFSLNGCGAIAGSGNQ